MWLFGEIYGRYRKIWVIRRLLQLGETEDVSWYRTCWEIMKMWRIWKRSGPQRNDKLCNVYSCSILLQKKKKYHDSLKILHRHRIDHRKTLQYFNFVWSHAVLRVFKSKFPAFVSRKQKKQVRNNVTRTTFQNFVKLLPIFPPPRESVS